MALVWNLPGLELRAEHVLFCPRDIEPKVIAHRFYSLNGEQITKEDFDAVFAALRAEEARQA